MKNTAVAKTLIIVLTLLGIHKVGNAVDSISVEVANGNKTQMVRVGAQWDWDRQWSFFEDGIVSGYWDLSAAQWHGRRYLGEDGATQNLTDIGIAPVFRYQNISRLGPYLEAGIGVHYLSDSYDSNGKALSTHLQFGTHIGAGYIFSNNMALTLKIQHFSNGGIKKPNSGVDFAVIGITHRF